MGCFDPPGVPSSGGGYLDLPLQIAPVWRGRSGEVDLSRIYAAPITRLGCLAFEGQGAFAPQS